jgi:hypothetical protein
MGKRPGQNKVTIPVEDIRLGTAHNRVTIEQNKIRVRER